MIQPLAHLVPAARLPRSLGSVPRGFYESSLCDATSPAFVRGYLIDKVQYDAMGPDQRLALLSYWQFPRWTLYGGPISTRQNAEQWSTYMTFWADGQGLVWLDYGTACVVPDWELKWPPDHGMRWDWVYETEVKKAVKVYDPVAGKNKWQWVSGQVGAANAPAPARAATTATAFHTTQVYWTFKPAHFLAPAPPQLPSAAVATPVLTIPLTTTEPMLAQILCNWAHAHGIDPKDYTVEMHLLVKGVWQSGVWPPNCVEQMKRGGS